MSDDIIRFVGVSKVFNSGTGTLLAATNINLTVKRGEFVTLVGPSGCGKSTLLNMTAGIFQPTTGDVFYDGVPVSGYNLKVGYMTQNDHLLPWRDVAGNIAIPLELRKLDSAAIAKRVSELIELVGLGGFSKSYPSQLSGGMRKRAALARLLAYDPETILMDEPFGALDAQLRLRMQAELKQLCIRLNKTVLFVTHDLDEAIGLADRCAVFTPRPGTIKQIVEVPLPRDREITKLRHDPTYNEMTAKLWDELTPEH